MSEDEMKNLTVGDVVRHAGDSVRYVVTANYGDRVTAVASVDLTNPPEWTVVMKAKHELYLGIPKIELLIVEG